MDFESCFTRTVSDAIQMEASWFYELNKQDDDPAIERKHRHSMPFLYSNLRFQRGISTDPTSNKNISVRLVPRKRRQHLIKAEQQRQKRLARLRKTPDLLFTIFKHRTKDYNQALLEKPRRQTRSSIKAKKRVAKKNKPRRKYSNATAKKTTPASKADIKVDYDSKDEQGNIVTASQPSEGSSSVQSVIDYTKTILNAIQKQKRMPSNDDTPQPKGAKTSNTLTTKKKKKDSISDHATTGISPRAKVVLSCLYINPQDGSMAMQSDTNVIRGCRRCHLCFFRTKSDGELLMHFRACHGEFLEFTANKCENSTLHIVARKKRGKPESYPSRLKNFTFVRYPKIKLAEIPPIDFVKRSLVNIVSMDKATRVKKMRLLNEQGAPSSAVTQFQPNSDEPVRQYYHSRTNEPMVDGEWDHDSDEESDKAWFEKMSEDLIDDFEDVTDSEKLFIFMWNRFMKSHTVVPDLAIPNRCLRFIRMHTAAMEKHNLRHELNLHLMGLWDHRLLSQSHLHFLMKEYDKLAMEIPDKKEVIDIDDEPETKRRRIEIIEEGNGISPGGNYVFDASTATVSLIDSPDEGDVKDTLENPV